MSEREMKSEAVAVRIEAEKVVEGVKEEPVKWIEEEVEELERWDGME